MAPINPEVEAKTTASTLNRLTTLVFDYDLRKGHSKAWFRELERRHELWKNMPENWEDAVRGSLALLSVFGPGVAASAFVRAVGPQLPPDELALVRFWRSHPWHLVVFQVKKSLGSGFVLVAPLGLRPSTWPADSPWDEFRLFSPNISSRQETHSALLLALLWPQETGCMTYGPILDFPGWTVKDFHYLAALAMPAPQRAPVLKGLWPEGRSLTADLTRHPVVCYLLTSWSSQPVMMGPLGANRFQISAASFDEPALEQEDWWKARARKLSEEVGTFTNLAEVTEVYLGDGSSMKNPWFLVAHQNRTVYLGALSAKAYQRGRKFLDGVASFPPQPSVDVSATAWIAAGSLFPQWEDTYDRLSRQLEESQKSRLAQDDELQNEKQQLEKVMERLVNNYNEGISESTQMTATALGVDPSVVLQLANVVDKGNSSGSSHKSLLNLPPRALHELSSAKIPHSEGYIVPNFQTIAPELIDSAPLVRLFRRFIDIAALAGGRIPATASGYLDTQLVRELWLEFRAVDPGSHKVTLPHRELDWFWLSHSRRQFEGAGFLALDKRGFFITDKARELLDQPQALFKELLNYGLHTAEWGPPERTSLFQMSLRRCYGLLIYALGALSARAKNKEKWIDSKLLAQVWMEQITLQSQEDIAIAVMMIEEELKLLLVKGLFYCLGLAEIHAKDLHSWSDDLRIRPTPLYHALFSVTPFK